MGQAKLRGSQEQRVIAAKEQVVTPIQVLNAFASGFPDIWKYVNTGFFDTGEFGHKRKADDQVFLSYIAWWFILLRIKQPKIAQKMLTAHRLIQNGMPTVRKLDMPFNAIPETMAIADIGAWRYTKGIYKINDDIAPYLINSEFNGHIPLDKIKKLPEWSIYVDCENLSMTARDKKIVGFWASINYFPATLYTGQRVLHFTMLFEDTFGTDFSTCISLDAANQSIEEDTKKISGWFKQGMEGDALQQLVAFKKKALQIILYICQDEPDILEDDVPLEQFDQRPQIQRIKGEQRLFEAKRVRHFDVGVKAGRVIRDALNNYRSSGKTQEPHIRRAHWHGYWKGSKKNNAQEFFYKWIAPVIVNGDLAPSD